MKTIQSKISSAFGLMLFLSAFMAGFGYYSLLKLQQYAQLTNDIDFIRLQTQSFFIAQKEFLLHETKSDEFYKTHKSKNLNLSLHKLKVINQKITNLQAYHTLNQDTIKRKLDKLEKQINEDFNLFKQVVEKQWKIGFQDWGLQGELREAIHQIENAPLPYNKVQMLMFRRHEKDFLLRNKIEYVTKFNQLCQVFQKGFEKSTNAKWLILEKQVQIYQSKFNELVRDTKELGFQESEGLKGRLKNLYEEINKDLNEVHQFVQTENFKAYKQILYAFLIVFLLQLGIGMYFGLRFSKYLSKRVVALKDMLNEMAIGKPLGNFQNVSQDELGLASEALQMLNLRIETATKFAEKIGQGQLNLPYQTDYKEGFLEKALIEMQHQLQMSAEEKAKQSWVSVGLANFMELMHKELHLQSKQQIAQKILCQLIPYVQAQMGCMMLLNTQRTLMEVVALYACNKEMANTRQIEQGEGIAGQALLQNKTIYLQDIPELYFEIESGLGSTKPKHLLFVPIKTSKSTIGVIEIASIYPFETHKIEFIEKLAENIAYQLVEFD